MTNLINKLIAALLIVLGLIFLLSGAGDDAGLFGVLGHWALALLMIATGIGFWRGQGWAFLLVSIALLVEWFIFFIRILVAADKGESVTGPIVLLLLNMAVIAWLGRWSMEKRFRPHLDVDH